MVEMIPSVQERKKNVHTFMNSYPHLCRLQNTVPNPSIKVNSSNNILDFVGDRLKLDDWKPVLEAISNDKSLHFISIRSRHSKAKVLKEIDTESQVQQVTKSSPLFTNCILVKITEALSKCLSNSAALRGLSLEKIPLTSNSIHGLTQGLEVNQNLQQLSLPHTQLGDDQCAVLCHVLRQRLNLVWLNLSGCGLTDKGAVTLCNLLKFQKLNRYGESWKQSLRYRPVNPNVMPGLRRLTLNYNPIGDAGVKTFVETIIDDLWLKALDLQHCDITVVGAEALMNLVKENQFLSVVDIRGNLQVPNSLVAAIVQQLAKNNCDVTPEFQWLKEDIPSSSGSTTTVSSGRASQRLSSVALSSKALSVLPNKARIILSRTRSSSAKRVHTTNNTPRPPWNSNMSNPSLRRGKSDQLIPTRTNMNQDVMSELRSVKEQLQEVSRRLEEETERRIKIECELGRYKQILDLPNGCGAADKAMLQSMFLQFYKIYLAKDTAEPLQLQETSGTEDKPSLQKHDSLESVIRTINGENPPDLRPDVSDTPQPSHPDSAHMPSKAQMLFESLISS